MAGLEAQKKYAAACAVYKILRSRIRAQKNSGPQKVRCHVYI